MNPELTGIPFDHYQRYGAASSLVHALDGPVHTILEVGANRQRILKSFLPEARFVFSDLEPQESVEEGSDIFVQADATRLPFADREFDVVVSLDVMEHIPPGLRQKATSEMARTASRAVIIGCPLDFPWVHEAEARANAVWERQYGEAYPWLEEHKEFGLVDPAVVEEALRDAGLRVIRFGQGDVAVWSGMMSAHFMKEAVPELAGLVASADRLYNERVFAGDRSDRAYREFFVGVRDVADHAALSASKFLNAPPEEAIKRVLAGLPSDLNPTVERLSRAEQEWANTAAVVRDLQGALGAERAESARIVEESDAITAQRNAIAAERDDARAQREQSDALRREAEIALRYSDDALTRSEQRAMELVLSTSRIVALADSVTDQNNELKQDLAQSQTHRDILTQRVHTLERRQRIAFWALSLLFAVTVAAALTYHFAG